ncbi:MAG: hypothetical protein KDJ52_09495 [Anaerolineae bacterium]|nr:hypothetical protein [Anaerolineae bacterium]
MANARLAYAENIVIVMGQPLHFKDLGQKPGFLALKRAFLAAKEYQCGIKTLVSKKV